MRKKNKKKAIIIAAGRGNRLNSLTKERPKCLLKINGKTILERQLKMLRICGIDDIIIIRGYKAEMINFPGVKYYENRNYLTNNILNSLFYAERELRGEIIVLYSDILFNESVVKKLLENKKDISVIVDINWKDSYQGRTKHPIEEAENVIIEDNKIKKIGKHITVKEANGEFIGIVKFNKKGSQILKKEFKRLREKYWGKPFQKAKSFEKAYLTDMLQELIDRGIKVYPVEIRRKWWEIDTKQDLERVKKIFKVLEK